MWSRASRWAVGLAAALVAITLVVWIDHGAVAADVDRPVERWAIARRTSGWTVFFRHATNLGAPGYMFAGGLLLALIAAPRSMRMGLTIAGLAVVRPLASAALKAAVDRPRPHLSQLVHASDASFPSGHALAATVCWLAAPAVAGLWLGRPIARVVAVLAGLVVLIVMASRVYLGVHWPTDVVGGAVLGLLLLVPLYALRVPRLAE